MQRADSDHRQQWQPPTRPEWVQRLNEEGACMDIRAVVPLDEASLLDAAMRSTGLSDFGADDWREPFRILIKSLDEEAELNLTGRVRTRSELLQLLEARLRIEETYKRHPEIDNEKILAPIIIIGQGRSGTSFLQNLLAANPDNGTLTHWEMTFPCPPPEKATYHSDPRIARTDRLIKQWVRVTPTMAAMHEFGGALPFECMQLLALNFHSSWCDALGQVASYDAYTMTHDVRPALRYHRRVLKLLQWKNPRRHWVLKDPFHLDRLAPLLELYPDARFIWPHRDPVRALASTVSMLGTLQWGRCDRPFMGGSFAAVTDVDLSAARFNAVIDQLDAGVVPPGQIAHVLYRDLVRDPMAAVEQLYAQLNLSLSSEGRAGMAHYLADHPRDSRPSHQFNIGSAEAVAHARAAYARYERRFGIPEE